MPPEPVHGFLCLPVVFTISKMILLISSTSPFALLEISVKDAESMFKGMYIDQYFIIIDFHCVVHNVRRLRQYTFRADDAVGSVNITFLNSISFVSPFSFAFYHSSLFTARLMRCFLRRKKQPARKDLYLTYFHSIFNSKFCANRESLKFLDPFLKPNRFVIICKKERNTFRFTLFSSFPKLINCIFSSF